jgi:hypothetical protein
MGPKTPQHFSVGVLGKFFREKDPERAKKIHQYAELACKI